MIKMRTKKRNDSNTGSIVIRYDHEMGIVRIIDTSFSIQGGSSISPSRLNRELRQSIKKDISAKSV